MLAKEEYRRVKQEGKILHLTSPARLHAAKTVNLEESVRQHKTSSSSITVQSVVGRLGVGLQLKQLREKKVISQIDPAGSAAASGTLSVGDEVVSIDGVDLQVLPVSTATALLEVFYVCDVTCGL